MRVVIADDIKLFREPLAQALERNGIEVVGQAQDGEQLITVTRATNPDLLLIDLRMPEDDHDAGLRAAIRIRQEQPSVGVILLSQHGEIEYAADLLAAIPNRVGYVLKGQSDIANLIDMMTRVAAGEIVLDPQIISRLVERRRRIENTTLTNPFDRLTPRELQVLSLMAQGFSNAAIATQLKSTDGAVEKAITSIRRKLHLDGIDGSNVRVKVVLAYLRHTGRLR